MDPLNNDVRNRSSTQRNNQQNTDDVNSEIFNFNTSTYPYKSCDDYASAVNQWLWLCYNWQCMSITLPFSISQASIRAQNTNPDGTTDFNRNFPNAFFPNQNFSLFQSNSQNNATHDQNNQNSFQFPHGGRTYIIPSLLKRFAAEAIDFSILLILKIIVTYFAIEFFDFVNFDKYDLDLMRNSKLDYRTAMEVTSEILALELIHRFLVCIFEALFTYKGISSVGGATPGKSMMKLRIVSCEAVVQLDRNHVRVYPAEDLGIMWALIRSFVKNFSYAFIFPICCTMYFFQHNRTAYDHMCGSIVVEELPNRTQQ